QQEQNHGSSVPEAVHSDSELHGQTGCACTILGPGAGPSAVLREDEHGVRPDGERAVERHLVISSRHSVAVAAEGPTEQAAVPLPVAVEAQPPPPAARQADDVVVVAAVAEIGDHDDIIARSPPLPAVVGQDPATLVDVMDADVLPAQSSRDAGAVQPQRDQVAVKVHDSAVSLKLRDSTNSCPWKSIGMPGAVSRTPAARVERFWACHPAGSHGLISWAR